MGILLSVKVSLVDLRLQLDCLFMENIINFVQKLFETMVKLSRPKKFARFQIITYSTFAVY